MDTDVNSYADETVIESFTPAYFFDLTPDLYFKINYMKTMYFFPSHYS